MLKSVRKEGQKSRVLAKEKNECTWIVCFSSNYRS
jgi:hypothetical protein